MVRGSQSQEHGGRAFQAEERASVKTLRWDHPGMSENYHKASVFRTEVMGAGKT